MTTTAKRNLEPVHNGWAALVLDAITTNADLGGESREEIARRYLQPGAEGLQLYWNEHGAQLEQRPHVNEALCSALEHQATTFDADGLDIIAGDCRWLAGCVRSGLLVLEATNYQNGY